MPRHLRAARSPESLLPALSRSDRSHPGGGLQPLERLPFERLLADLIAVFVDLPAERVEPEIENAMCRLLAFLGFDRCGFAEVAAADGSIVMVCSVAVNSVPQMAIGPFPEQLQWYQRTIRAGQMIILDDLPGDLPDEAVAEREYVTRIGMRSQLSIPLNVGGKLFGAIGFAAFHRTRPWPPELIRRIKTAGEVLAGALARSRMEAELQRMRSELWRADRIATAGALTGSLAHELNQPLTAILSNAQAALRFLERGDADHHEIRCILESIVREDKRAGGVLRGLRALLGREQGLRAQVDVGDALREVLVLMHGKLEDQGIHVEPQLGVGCVVLADRTQLQQVAINLIGNAVDAMRPVPQSMRRLSIAVSFAGANDAPGEVAVTIRDSGVGIAPDRLPLIFRPFCTTKDHGLGLGLSIARAIAEAHDGHISVQPNEDGGVTFTFSLPGRLARPPRSSDDNDSPQRKLHAAALPASTICIVDDEETVREGLTRLVAAAGFAVESFRSGADLLQWPAIDQATCLLLDVRMPGMDGLALHSRLRAIGIEAPVVFLTGDGDVQTGVEAMKLGAVDYLLKPVDDGLLLDTVRRAVGAHAARQQRQRQRQTIEVRLGRLSARERDVMQFVVQGRLNKQIAAELGIAEKTVKQHRGRVMEKLGVKSVAELVRLCESFDIARPRLD